MNKKIVLTSGTGTGNTELSAFDAALFHAGIANHNLIPLSSVIPEGFQVKLGKPALNKKGYGDRLYVVIAQHRQSQFGDEAWAGLGWITTTKAPYKGLFVEHHGDSKEFVERAIKQSLTDMRTYRSEKFGKIHMHLSGIRCDGTSVCALVAAIYKSESWG